MTGVRSATKFNPQPELVIDLSHRLEFGVRDTYPGLRRRPRDSLHDIDCPMISRSAAWGDTMLKGEDVPL